MMTDREFRVWFDVLLANKGDWNARDHAKQAVLALREMDKEPSSSRTGTAESVDEHSGAQP